MANKLYEEKKYAESIPFLDRAIELKPDYAWAYTRRGVAYNELKKYQRALEDYSRAIELDSKGAWAYGCRGKNYNDLKEYELAMDDLNQALTLSPECHYLQQPGQCVQQPQGVRAGDRGL